VEEDEEDDEQRADQAGGEVEARRCHLTWQTLLPQSVAILQWHESPSPHNLRAL
jgi:hypothetical protein